MTVIQAEELPQRLAVLKFCVGTDTNVPIMFLSMTFSVTVHSRTVISVCLLETTPPLHRSQPHKPKKRQIITAMLIL
jgi:hypothetical protein